MSIPTPLPNPFASPPNPDGFKLPAKDFAPLVNFARHSIANPSLYSLSLSPIQHLDTTCTDQFDVVSLEENITTSNNKPSASSQTLLSPSPNLSSPTLIIHPDWISNYILLLTLYQHAMDTSGDFFAFLLIIAPLSTHQNLAIDLLHYYFQPKTSKQTIRQRFIRFVIQVGAKQRTIPTDTFQLPTALDIIALAPHLLTNIHPIVYWNWCLLGGRKIIAASGELVEEALSSSTRPDHASMAVAMFTLAQSHSPPLFSNEFLNNPISETDHSEPPQPWERFDNVRNYPIVMALNKQPQLLPLLLASPSASTQSSLSPSSSQSKPLAFPLPLLRLVHAINTHAKGDVDAVSFQKMTLMNQCKDGHHEKGLDSGEGGDVNSRIRFDDPLGVFNEIPPFINDQLTAYLTTKTPTTSTQKNFVAVLETWIIVLGDRVSKQIWGEWCVWKLRNAILSFQPHILQCLLKIIPQSILATKQLFQYCQGIVDDLVDELLKVSVKKQYAVGWEKVFLISGHFHHVVDGDANKCDFSSVDGSPIPSPILSIDPISTTFKSMMTIPSLRRAVLEHKAPKHKMTLTQLALLTHNLDLVQVFHNAALLPDSDLLNMKDGECGATRPSPLTTCWEATPRTESDLRLWYMELLASGHRSDGRGGDRDGCGGEGNLFGNQGEDRPAFDTRASPNRQTPFTIVSLLSHLSSLTHTDSVLLKKSTKDFISGFRTIITKNKKNGDDDAFSPSLSSTTTILQPELLQMNDKIHQQEQNQQEQNQQTMSKMNPIYQFYSWLATTIPSSLSLQLDEASTVENWDGAQQRAFTTLIPLAVLMMLGWDNKNGSQWATPPQPTPLPLILSSRQQQQQNHHNDLISEPQPPPQNDLEILKANLIELFIVGLGADYTKTTTFVSLPIQVSSLWNLQTSLFLRRSELSSSSQQQYLFRPLVEQSHLSLPHIGVIISDDYALESLLEAICQVL